MRVFTACGRVTDDVLWRLLIQTLATGKVGWKCLTQEAQLPQRDRATRYVSKFVQCFTSYENSLFYDWLKKCPCWVVCRESNVSACVVKVTLAWSLKQSYLVTSISCLRPTIIDSVNVVSVSICGAGGGWWSFQIGSRDQLKEHCLTHKTGTDLWLSVSLCTFVPFPQCPY